MDLARHSGNTSLPQYDRERVGCNAEPFPWTDEGYCSQLNVQACFQTAIFCRKYPEHQKGDDFSKFYALQFPELGISLCWLVLIVLFGFRPLARCFQLVCEPGPRCTL